MVFNVATTTITDGEIADYVIGRPNFTTTNDSTTNATTQSTVGGTLSVNTFIPTNNSLLVSDFNNNRILVYNVATSAIANGENASGELGHSNSTSTPEYTKNEANFGPNNYGLYDPGGAGLDTNNHRLFVADGGHARVMVYQLDSNNHFASSTAIYVLGAPDFTTNSHGCTQTTLGGLIAGVVYDTANDRLFVSDRMNSRVTVYNVAPGTISNGQNASYVIGQPNFTSCASGSHTQSLTSSPDDIGLDIANQRLFVSDADNNRVLIFNVAPGTIANGMNASYVLGQSNFTNFAAATTEVVCIALLVKRTMRLVNACLLGTTRITETLVFNIATSTITNGENADYVLGAADFTTKDPGNNVTATTTAADDLMYDPVHNLLFDGSWLTPSRLTVFNVATSTMSNGPNLFNVIGQSDYTSNNAGVTQNTWGGSLMRDRHMMQPITGSFRPIGITTV